MEARPRADRTESPRPFLEKRNLKKDDLSLVHDLIRTPRDERPETGTDMLTGEPSDRRVLFAKAYQPCPPRLNFYERALVSVARPACPQRFRRVS